MKSSCLDIQHWIERGKENSVQIISESSTLFPNYGLSEQSYFFNSVKALDNFLFYKTKNLCCSHVFSVHFQIFSPTHPIYTWIYFLLILCLHQAPENIFKV